MVGPWGPCIAFLGGIYLASWNYIFDCPGKGPLGGQGSSLPLSVACGKAWLPSGFRDMTHFKCIINDARELWLLGALYLFQYHSEMLAFHF
ncbi:hypothetical protein TNIN_78541 [Trichonephila inaurata madagascariensis]|uniref:Uncharacterized protein n=1 Tax=Trichonephila inaurata madagascariensis TaxID=2747483 RepID=A0A8X6M515_9ARAC|nr:hypothetical protein TNIN_78541 [Trichonephila inaurata madagascariensis]